MKYHFDIREDGVLETDEFGMELASDEEARIEAQSLAIEALKAYRFSAEAKTVEVKVRRADGRQVYAATLELTGRWARALAEPHGAGQPRHP
jgi:hypothetical protein